jgi:hypothetical protein
MRLPLPLAQLYSRAHNAKDARGRHDSTIYLFEALIKLTVTPLVVTYAREATAGGPRCHDAHELFSYLTRPSLGHYLLILRQLSRHFGEQPDADSHPLGRLWAQFKGKRTDLPATLALYGAIKNGPDGSPTYASAVQVSELFDALVVYRNMVMSHGGPRPDSFYERLGLLLFDASNELLDERRFSWWGPTGTRLLHLDDVRKLDEQHVELALRELSGLHSERLPPSMVDADDAVDCSPNQVAILWPGETMPLSLHPLLLYQEIDLSEEVFFFHGRSGANKIEYLSYGTGRTLREPGFAAALDRLFSLPDADPTAAATPRPPKKPLESKPEVVTTVGPTDGVSAEAVLAQLLIRLDEFSSNMSAQFNELRDGIRRAVRIAQDDPEMSLTRARKVLDYIVRDVYDVSMKKEKAGTQPLDSLLQRLVKENHLPTRIAAHANTVRNWGNVGTHTFGEQITPDDVLQSLNSLLPIVQWYFEQKQAGSPPTQTPPS